MQNLIDRGFLVKEANDNYLTDTIDIAYVADKARYVELALDTTPSAFEMNDGLYTVHCVEGTNLYVIHIEGHQQTRGYPAECPDGDGWCPDVQPPGCVMLSDGSACAPNELGHNVCSEPDSPVSFAESACNAEVDAEHIALFKSGDATDMCANVMRFGSGRRATYLAPWLAPLHAAVWSWWAILR